MVAFGPVVMRVEEPTMASQTAASFPSAAPSAATFTAGDQYAHQLNMVGGHQYNAYTNAVVARESFIREVAATRTKARRLVWFGVALFVVGFAAFAGTLLRFMAQADNAFPSEQFDVPSDSPFSINGFPLGLIGWTVAAVGIFLIVTGVILHVVATARQRHFYQRMPLPPPPWLGHGSPQQLPPTYER